jgi:hypothetical protein
LLLEKSIIQFGEVQRIRTIFTHQIHSKAKKLFYETGEINPFTRLTPRVALLPLCSGYVRKSYLLPWRSTGEITFHERFGIRQKLACGTGRVLRKSYQSSEW